MEREQLIAEVARSTGVRLDRSDPILAAAVVHEALLNEVLVKLDRQVTIQADRVTAASTQAVADAQRQAELLLTEAGAWMEVRMKFAGEAAAAIVLAELRQELQAAQKARRALVGIAWFVAVFGLLALSGIGELSWQACGSRERRGVQSVGSSSIHKILLLDSYRLPSRPPLGRAWRVARDTTFGATGGRLGRRVTPRS